MTSLFGWFVDLFDRRFLPIMHVWDNQTIQMDTMRLIDSPTTTLQSVYLYVKFINLTTMSRNVTISLSGVRADTHIDLDSWYQRLIWLDRKFSHRMRVLKSDARLLVEFQHEIY